MCVKVGRPSVPNLQWQRGITQLKLVNTEMKAAIVTLKADGKAGAAIPLKELNKVEEDDAVKNAMDNVVAELNFSKQECRRLKNDLTHEQMGKLAVTRQQKTMEQQNQILETEMDDMRTNQRIQLDQMMTQFQQGLGTSTVAVAPSTGSPMPTPSSTQQTI
jgi:hypothetical protein